MRCYFHLVNSHEEILDDEGIEVQDLKGAKLHAQKAIRELRQEIGEEAEGWRGWRLDVVCSEGSLLHSIPLSETLH
jgi:hypothetical protein